MILYRGFQEPSKIQLMEAKSEADASFCAASSEAFMSVFPQFQGWQSAEKTATLLKLKNVEPHDDPWVSRGGQPKVRRAIFWLMEGGWACSGAGVVFGCGRATVRLVPGDFVVFNDSTTHWVMSNRQWLGASIQLRKIK